MSAKLALAQAGIVAPSLLAVALAGTIAITLLATAGVVGGDVGPEQDAHLQDTRNAACAGYAAVGAAAAAFLAIEASKRGLQELSAVPHWLRGIGVVLLSVAAAIGLVAAVQFRATQPSATVAGAKELENNVKQRHVRASRAAFAALALACTGSVSLLCAVVASFFLPAT